MPALNRIAEYFDEMKEWRTHLHAHPELDFDCTETAGFVADKLRSFGVDEIHEGIGKTGLVGIVNGKGPGSTIGLRADMDALPIQEIRDLPYKSKTDGKMHACGHDGHTTMLLGAAKYLCETRNFEGRVALIFQPAEEGGGGGRVMCAEGLMPRFDIAQVYALHNWPNLPKGSLHVSDGPMMAAADTFTIHVRGKGGHAAMPNTTIDTVLVAAQITQSLQSIIARRLDPIDTGVITVTQFHAGDTNNVIPDTAILGGTVRFFKPEVQELIRTEIERIITQTAAAFGASAKMDYEVGYPATINHASNAQFAGDVATALMGADMVNRTPNPSMGSEDFSYMIQERPGAYVYLGQGKSAGLHHPEYDFNDEISPIGASFFVKLVETAQPV